MDKIQNINLNQIAKMNDTSQELINKSNQPGDDKTHEEENSKIENLLLSLLNEYSPLS